VKGIYDGLMILVILQFILSICFPVLNMSMVTKIFHESAEYWATRGGNRVGAVGFFKHPGNLGLFITLASTFFFASYLKQYRARTSLLLLGMSAAIVFLTFSRTSYITFIITSSVIFFYHFFGKKREVNVKSLIKIILPIGLFIYWVIFLSPFAS